MIDSFNYNNFDEFDDDFNLTNFDLIITKLDLKPNFFLSRDEDIILVNEIWSTKKSSVVVDKIYEFDILYIDLVTIDIRKKVLEEVLEIYINEEKYELASEIRDILILLNSTNCD